MEIVTVITFIFILVVLLFSVVIHELAHGSVAYSLGDPTAKYEGRLTLNPLNSNIQHAYTMMSKAKIF